MISSLLTAVPRAGFTEAWKTIAILKTRPHSWTGDGKIFRPFAMFSCQSSLIVIYFLRLFCPQPTAFVSSGSPAESVYPQRGSLCPSGLQQKNGIDRKGKANDPLAIHLATSFRRLYEAISDMDCSLLKRAVSRACDRVYHNQTKRTPDGRTACFHTDHSCFLSAAEAEALQTPGKIGAYL